MTREMKPIAKLVEYFGDGNPVIVEEKRNGGRWTRPAWRKRASMSYIRKLKRAGVTHVALTPANDPRRVADFSTAELLRLG